MTRTEDTIFALATAPGKAGVAIVRVSGEGSVAALTNLAGEAPEPRYMALRRLVDGGTLIDQALVVRFEAGASYTGEDLVELHLHGGRAVVDRVFSALLERGLRIAEPGEFTRRAFEAGVLDLAQVEAVADLVDADTEAQRKQAAAVIDGALSKEVKALQDLAREALAYLEASIDFADEEDAPMDVTDIVQDRLQRMLSNLERLLNGAQLSQNVREGFTVALVGPPNVGKSSLINALSRRQTSIVSPYEGTTRDVISSVVSIEGLSVELLDTAGLRETDDPVEQIGVQAACKRAEQANLRLHLRSIDTNSSGSEALWRPGDLSIWSKADLGSGPGEVSLCIEDEFSVDAVRKAIALRLAGTDQSSSLVAHRWQAQKLEASVSHIRNALVEVESEIQAHLIREAMLELSGLLGEVDIEAVLGDIFSRFCIGK